MNNKVCIILNKATTKLRKGSPLTTGKLIKVSMFVFFYNFNNKFIISL